MAHQELAAEIMAMRLAADEAEEKRIERKIVKVKFDRSHDEALILMDVGNYSKEIFIMNSLFDAGWSIERELKVQQQVELCYDMGSRRDRTRGGFLNLKSKLHLDFTNVPHAVH